MTELSWETATVAELYLKQGQTQRAIAIYRALTQRDPQDESAQARLRALESSNQPSHDALPSIRAHLRRLVHELPGAIGSAVVGINGMVLDLYQRDTMPRETLQAMLVEYAGLAQHLHQSGQENTSLGQPSELLLRTTRHTALLRALTPQHLLATVLEPQALTGKTRYLMQIVAPPITQALH